jgi:hypothetical protein
MPAPRWPGASTDAPAAGTVPRAGSGQRLPVPFMREDATDPNEATTP